MKKDSGIPHETDSSSSSESDDLKPDTKVRTKPTTKKMPNAKIQLPPNVGPLEIEGQSTTNLAVKWSNWITQFKLYLVAADLKNESDERKVALLLTLIGPQGMVVFHSFNVKSEEIKYDALVKMFDDHFTPKKNVTVERHNFLTRRQADQESIDDFVTSLKTLSLTCELNDLRDSLVKDVLICGLNKYNFKMKERLLQEDNLTLERAISICKSLELTHQQAQSIQKSSENEVIHKVSSFSRNSNQYSGNERQYNTSRQGNRNTKNRSQSPSNQRTDWSGNRQQSAYNQRSMCTRCGQIHRVKCPAYGQQCLSCGRMNHFSKMCRKKSVRNVNVSGKSSQNANINTVSVNDREYFVSR